MPLVTDRDKQVIRSVLDRLNGIVGNQDDINGLHKLVKGFARSDWDSDCVAFEIAVAFIRLSEDLKEQLSSRGEVAPQGMARLEAQVSANRSRIDELEKLVVSLEGSVESFMKRVSRASSESHPVKVGDVVFGKAVVEVLWQLQGDSMVPAYRLYGESEFRSIGPLEA